MASIWRTPSVRTGPPGPQSSSLPNPLHSANLAVHSLVAGNGQHYTLPPRTGGQPWIGHKGNAPQQHAFGPSESFASAASLSSGHPSAPVARNIYVPTASSITQQTGITVGRSQAAPGGARQRAVQTAPGKVGY